MDAQLISIARNCLNAAYDKTMAFPEIVGSLSRSGFEGYAVDYRRNTTTYFLTDGDSVVLENRPSDGAVAPQFDQHAVAAQIKWAQANLPDYSYAAFCKHVKSLGCAGYIVSFLGRRVLYFGRTAENIMSNTSRPRPDAMASGGDSVRRSEAMTHAHRRSFELSPLTPRFGVEVACVDLSRVTPEDIYPALRSLFEAHSALLFRGQSLSDDDHLRLAALFGPIEDREADTRKPGEPIPVSPVSNVKADGGLTAEDDVHTLNLKANMLWHIDSTFMPVPALTNILIARVVASTGGRTELASTRAAFRDMPPALQARLRRTVLRHHYSQSRARISPELLAKLPRFHKWPEQRWNAVIANPATGEEAVYIASHCRAVEGLAEAEGAAFIDEVVRLCTQPQYVYSHAWRPGDVLLWDQRAVMHRGTPWPLNEPRTLTSLCVSLTDADGLAEMRPAQ